MIAEIRDVDAAARQRAPAQIADPARSFEIAGVSEQADAPRAARGSDSCASRYPRCATDGAPSQLTRLRRLLAHEAPFGRVRAEIAVCILQSDQIVGDALDAIATSAASPVRAAAFAAAYSHLPACSPYQSPFVIRVRVRRREQRDRRTGLVDDELREPAAMIRSQRLAENAMQAHRARRSELQQRPRAIASSLLFAAASCGVDDAAEADARRAVLARRHQQVLAMLVESIRLREVPVRGLRLIRSCRRAGCAARVCSSTYSSVHCQTLPTRSITPNGLAPCRMRIDVGGRRHLTRALSCAGTLRAFQSLPHG